jgi:hypothetical protein
MRKVAPETSIIVRNKILINNDIELHRSPPLRNIRRDFNLWESGKHEDQLTFHKQLQPTIGLLVVNHVDTLVTSHDYDS